MTWLAGSWSRLLPFYPAENANAFNLTCFFDEYHRESEPETYETFSFKKKTISVSLINLESTCPSAHAASTWSGYSDLSISARQKERDGGSEIKRVRWTQRERERERAPKDRERGSGWQKAISNGCESSALSPSSPRSQLQRSINSHYHLKAVLKTTKWDKQSEQTSHPAHTHRPAIRPT